LGSGNPKARKTRKNPTFLKPEKTRTRKTRLFENPKKPEPEKPEMLKPENPIRHLIEGNYQESCEHLTGAAKFGGPPVIMCSIRLSLGSENITL